VYQFRDAVVDEVKRLVTRPRARTPDGAMNRASSLAISNERRTVAIVVASDICGVEPRSHISHGCSARSAMNRNEIVVVDDHPGTARCNMFQSSSKPVRYGVPVVWRDLGRGVCPALDQHALELAIGRRE
jgi:hypothetical protein